ncbi:hypothetical protein [Paracoccus aminovorans]|uniref:hypothetical protein n=1 Tax=Paracoccus aminovorans TaxID=34004 RepID=UPI001114304A|nr:hypothetical protein [Paracoccus aminovorans]
MFHLETLQKLPAAGALIVQALCAQHLERTMKRPTKVSVRVIDYALKISLVYLVAQIFYLPPLANNWIVTRLSSITSTQAEYTFSQAYFGFSFISYIICGSLVFYVGRHYTVQLPAGLRRVGVGTHFSTIMMFAFCNIALFMRLDNVRPSPEFLRYLSYIVLWIIVIWWISNLKNSIAGISSTKPQDERK